MGTLPPCVARRYPPCPLIIGSTDPRRSNCGPPSPNPSSGESPVANETTPVARSTVNRWTVSFFAFAMLKVSGSGETLTLSSPQVTVCARTSPRHAATGGPEEDCTKDPLAGIGIGRPFTTGRILSRTVCALREATWISKSRSVLGAAPPTGISPPGTNMAVEATAICFKSSRRFHRFAPSAPMWFHQEFPLLFVLCVSHPFVGSRHMCREPGTPAKTHAGQKRKQTDG